MFMISQFLLRDYSSCMLTSYLDFVLFNYCTGIQINSISWRLWFHCSMYEWEIYDIQLISSNNVTVFQHYLHIKHPLHDIVIDKWPRTMYIPMRCNLLCLTFLLVFLLPSNYLLLTVREYSLDMLLETWRWIKYFVMSSFISCPLRLETLLKSGDYKYPRCSKYI